MSKPALKHLTILGMGLLALLAMGCVGKGYAAPKPDAAPVGLAGPARQDCGQIAGTAFRSDDERNWFQSNCSKWPETNFDSLISVRSSKPEDPACTAQRGKPYLNDKDRQWFLANCNPTGPNGTPTASGSDPVVFADSPSYSCAPSGPAATTTPTRSTNQPGATTTPSNSQNSSNCVQPRVANAGPTPAPGDRTDCYAISGTPYRSRSEETWYLATCFGGSPTGQPLGVSTPLPITPGGPISPGSPASPGGSLSPVPPAANTPVPGFQLSPQNYYCNPASPGYPNARGRVIQPC